MRNNVTAALFFIICCLTTVTVAAATAPPAFKIHAITEDAKSDAATKTASTTVASHTDDIPSTIVVPADSNAYRLSLAILNNYPDNNLNVSQVLQALVKNNRHAFVAGDANKIMADTTLTVPNLTQIKKYPSLSLPCAIKAVSKPKTTLSKPTAATPLRQQPAVSTDSAAPSSPNDADKKVITKETATTTKNSLSVNSALTTNFPSPQAPWHITTARFMLQHSVLFILFLILGVFIICYYNLQREKRAVTARKAPYQPANLDLDIDDFLATYRPTAAGASNDAATPEVKLKLLQKQLTELMEQTSDETVKQQLKSLIKQLD